MNLSGAIAAALRLPQSAGNLTRGALGQLNPGRRHRRVWSTAGRAHLEVRAVDRPGYEYVAKHVEAALCDMDGVHWAQVNPVIGRVVVSFDQDALDVDDLQDVISAVERYHGVEGERFPSDRPEHPGDIEPLRRTTISLGADVLGLGVSVFGQALRFTPFPVELAALVSLAEQQPRIREFFERCVGVPATDLGLGVSSALAQAVAQGPFGLAVDIGHRANLAGELRARRASWERLEPFLSSLPAEEEPSALGPDERPVKLRSGPLERYADASTVASVGAIGLALGATGSPRRAAGLVVAGLPKASRLGREAFAALIGRELARRDVLVLDGTVLRRLDRIDVVVLDAQVVMARRRIGAVEALGSSSADLHAVLTDLFDPHAPRQVHRRAQWTVGPLPQLEGLGLVLPDDVTTRAEAMGVTSSELVGVVNGGTLVGIASVDRDLDPLAETLAETIRRCELELVVADGPPWLAERLGAAASVPGGARLAASVRALQAEGVGVLLVSTGAAHEGLAAADCAVGILDAGDVIPWGADLLTGPGLADAHFVVESTAVARRVSTRSARLALAGTGVGGLWAFAGPAGGAGRRAAVPVNAAALAAQLQAFAAARTLRQRPRPVAGGATPWHEMDGAAVLAALGTSRAGLTQEQVRERGIERPRRPPPALFRLPQAVGAELANPLTPILGVGAAMAAAVGSVTDAGLVASVVAANALIGGVQRLRAEVSIEHLLEVSSTLVTVRRPGVTAVGREELVIGDVVELSVGDVVPADCRILEAEGCEADESVLTGESLPVPKDAMATPGVGVADRRCMLYEGTTVSSGRALAVVVAVGSETEVGRSLADAPEPPPSGVEARLTALTAVTVPVTMASGAAVTGIGLLRSHSPRLAISSGVSLMVAAVPEGLPLLASVAQLAAARRLSRRGALVRNPRTIEALGRVDTLCFDKTGTLTLGQIRLQRVSDGADDEPIDSLGPRSRAVLAAALRASPDTEGDDIALLPHATDRAVLAGAEEAGVSASDDLGGWEVLGQLAFDPVRGFHAVVGDSPDGPRVSVKGAPEVILPRCARWHGHRGSRLLDDALRGQLDAEVERLARRGLRVLAVAERVSSSRAEVGDERVNNMELLGFLGMADSVRPTAADAVTDLRAAGIEVVMITGDHPSTAEAIADELSMLNGRRVVQGSELDAMSDDELDRAVPHVSVFARVTPTHKVRIVRSYQRLGRVVAMTGDGANDAPAIRLANAGIAIGGRGSPAARAAADLVVVDDRIETILASIIEGRALWTSVRDALAILVGGNLGEVGFTLAATAISGASPLVARQFLLVNLLTDMLPAMTIALRPPAYRSPEMLLHEGPDASLGSSLTRQIALRATTTAGGALGAWMVARATGTRGRANTVALVALVGTQLAQTAAVGGVSPLVVASTAVSGAALIGIVQTPGVSHFFGCRPLGPFGWGIAVGAAGAATGASVLIPWVAQNRGRSREQRGELRLLPQQEST